VKPCADILRLSEVTYRYPDHSWSDKDALRAVSLRLATGEGLVALTGPNGSGKTTLLRLIYGQLEPYSGGVFLSGRDVTAEPIHRRMGLACVFQQADQGVCPELTIEENLCLMLMDAKPSLVRSLRTRSRVRDILDRSKECVPAGRQSILTDLGNSLQKYPAEFSGGELQQLCLLAVLLRRPPASLVLVDEPTLNLDQVNRQVCFDMLGVLAKSATILVATHDSELIRRCPRTLALENGQLISDRKDEAACPGNNDLESRPEM
jgi:ABC-type multidrug transport system ATPase subunit